MRRPRAGAAVCWAVALLAGLGVASQGAAAQSMAVQPDGKIVLAGRVSQELASQGGAMLRLDPNGSVDRSFGSRGGLLDFRLREAFEVLAVKPSGRIVATVGSAPAAWPEDRPCPTAGDTGRRVRGRSWSDPAKA